MGLFSKLFSGRKSPEAERAKAIIRKAWEDSRNPQGAHKAATIGAEMGVNKHPVFLRNSELGFLRNLTPRRSTSCSSEGKLLDLSWSLLRYGPDYSAASCGFTDTPSPHGPIQLVIRWAGGE